MAESSVTDSLAWLNIVVGLLVVVATLLTSGLEPAALWFSLVEGILLVVLAAWTSWGWPRMTTGRRTVLCALAALVAFALLAEWWSADFPVTLRRVMIALGLVGTAAGVYAAWKARAAA